MKTVFVDTNAFLGFFAFAADDLAQLKKLIDHIEKNEISLLLTDQIRDEFFRNREGKIAETIKTFESSGDSKGYPNLIRHHAKYKELTKAATTFKDAKKKILEDLKAQIAAKTLPADQIFSDILAGSPPIKTLPNDMAAARDRMTLGNPPGKKGSFGDAINWEILLRTVEKRTDLYLMSQDKDYISPLGEGKINGFLADEWKEKNGGQACLFPTLKELFERIAPEIKLSAETTAPAANSAVAFSNSAFGSFASVKSGQTFIISFDPLVTSAEDVAQNAVSLALSIRPSQIWTTQLVFEGCIELSTGNRVWPTTAFIQHLASIPGVTAVSSE